MSNILLVAALFPVAVLCYFIYKKDMHKEPKSLLGKLFGFGCLIVIPILIVELLLGNFFSTSKVYDFFTLFLNTFISIGIVEEGFKWIVVKKVGYDNQEFDEIYDIIVYSVFVSLGFACIENIIYVFHNGIVTAILRALTAVPGHTCFAVIMGYFLSKSKVNDINKNGNGFMRNLLLSLFIPTLIHTFYDAILLYASAVHSNNFIYVFYAFIIIMFCICFVIVDRISKVQSNITQNVQSGNIVYNQGVVQMNTSQINQNYLQHQTQPVANHSVGAINYCPICGTPAHGDNFCGFCGYKLK